MKTKKNKYSAVISNQKGYSMVEMVIVIAIIAVLSAVSFTTVSAIYTAKANSAGNTLDSQMAYLASMTKAQDASLAMLLYYDTSDGTYYMQQGKVDDTGAFTADTTKDKVALSNSIGLFYKAAGSTSESLVDDTGEIIRFSKSDGSVMDGAGTYRITKRGASGKTVLSVVLNKNTGSHYTK